MKNLRHVGIVVKDLEKSLFFYRDLLGLKVVRKMDESGSFIDTICGVKNIAVTTIKLAADDGSLIELLYFHSPESNKAVDKDLNRAGFAHVSFTVENIAEEYTRLNKAGVYFNSKPQLSSDGLAKVVFCRDNEGNFIELVEETKKT